MDLLLEDIGKEDWAASLVSTGREVVKFVVNHQASLAIFREHSTKELLMPGVLTEAHSCFHVGSDDPKQPLTRCALCWALQEKPDSALTSSC